MTEEQFITFVLPAFIGLQSLFSGLFIRLGTVFFEQWLGFSLTAWVIPAAFIFLIIARMPPPIIAVSTVAHVVGFVLTGWFRKRGSSGQA